MAARRVFARAITSALALLAVTAFAAAQGPPTIGSVRLPRTVRADGRPLPAGTYALRLSTASVTPVVGQSVESAVWVEFVQGTEVRGRELAVVIAPSDVKQVKGTPPPSGAVSVQTLRGGDYVRVWVNRAGTHYLVHLPAAK